MDIIDAIEKRRSIRKYSNQEVRKSDLKEIIRLATLAPSAHNRQPWKFVILKNKEKQKIVDMINDYCATNNDKRYKTANFTASVIENTNTLIIVMKEKNKLWHELDLMGTSAAIQNITLGALNFGLGTLWINHTDCVKEEIEAYLNINDYEMVSAVALGYPLQNPDPRPRKEIEDVLIYK
ncbi:MAG: nitroreductase family protein [Bacilli bacterium]|nr:nitroreductase family protein [Bacilli bacterium]